MSHIFCFSTRFFFSETNFLAEIVTRTKSRVEKTWKSAQYSPPTTRFASQIPNSPIADLYCHVMDEFATLKWDNKSWEALRDVHNVPRTAGFIVYYDYSSNKFRTIEVPTKGGKNNRKETEIPQVVGHTGFNGKENNGLAPQSLLDHA